MRSITFLRLVCYMGVLACCGRGHAIGAELPDPAAITAHVRAAAGTPPASLKSTVTFVASGLAGNRTTYRSGDDFREIVEEGPFKTERGSYHGQAWHQNENRETVLEQPEPGKAVRETYTATVGAIATPVAGYVMSRLNAAGRGTKEYVDGSTWRVVRRDVVRASETTVVTYDDFRTQSGFTRPWHWTVRDGHPENDADYHLAQLSGDVPNAELTIPRGGATFIDFPAGKHRVELPVRVDHGTFIVRLTIGTRGYDLILDTGAGGIMLDEDVIRELGLRVYGRSSNAEAAGRVTGGRAILPRADVGELHLHDVVIATIPHVGADSGGVYKTVGLLGFDFAAALALELDYEHGRATAIDFESFTPPPLGARTLALDVRLGEQQPLTDVAINGTVGERFVLDTGSQFTLTIFDYFERRHKGVLKDEGRSGVWRTQRALGVGGLFDLRPIQLAEVRLGKAMFKDYVAYAVRSRGTYGADLDGLVGSEFLKYFTMYVDYADSHVYLEPNGLMRP